MAVRKFLFMAADGFSEEAATTDHTIMSGLVIGSGSYSAGLITGVTGGAADGDVLVYGQSAGNLAGLTIDTANLTMSGGVTVTGLPAPTADTEAANKAYVDSLVTGLKWQAPASVLRIISDADQSAADPTAGSTGEAWLVNNWASETDGDIVEWDGAAWQTVVANVAGEPPDGTRVVVIEASAAGSFVGRENDIGTYATSGSTWSFEDPEDGWAILIIGENSAYENNGYVYDTNVWVQFTGTGLIIAGDGLSKDGNTLNVNAGDGIQIATDRVAIELDASNSGLALTGVTPDATLGVVANIAAGLDIDGSGVKVVLETDAGIVFDGTNGGLEINLETTNPTLDIVTNELGVKFSTTASGLDQDANGLLVKTDGSTTTINASGEVVALGVDEATRLENDFTATETVAAGDPVYFDATANQFSQATAGDNAEAYVFGVARTAITATNPGPIVSYGPCADVLTTATPGTRYYLGAAGGLTTTPPGAGNRVILIGWAINADDLWVQPIDYGKKAA